MREAALRKKASCYWAAEKEQKKLDGGDGGSIRMVEMVLYQPFSVTLDLKNEHVAAPVDCRFDVALCASPPPLQLQMCACIIMTPPKTAHPIQQKNETIEDCC